MKNIISTAAILLACTVSVFARVGDTEKELSARFGAPIMRSKDMMIAQGKVIELAPKLHYRQGDWSLHCDMVDGRCARIAYSKPGEWTDDQFLTVLTSNAQGLRWTDVTTGGL